MKIQFNFTQSGVVPYRIQDENLEVLLVTTIKKKLWSIPKGFVEFNLSGFESAKKEAYEEAGVIGSNESQLLGSFSVKKMVGTHNVKVYSMEVIKILEDYPEKEIRSRNWFNIDEAIEVVKKDDLKNILLKLKSLLLTKQN